MLRVVAFALAAAVLAPVAGAAAAPRLEPFAGCDGLVRYANRHAVRYEPGGPPQPVPPIAVSAPSQGSATAPTAAAAPAPAANDAGSSFSLTNNQEAGVFEPDTVKTDGRTVYALADGVLHVVDVRGAPTERSRLALGQGYGHQMLLYERKLLVTWTQNDGRTALALVDVGDPTRPTLLRTLTTDGDLLAERRTQSTVRVVLTVRPRAIAQPERADTSSAGAWLPTARSRNVRRGAASRRRALVGCRAVRRPRSFSGLESLTVLTIDFDKGLDPVDADALMTGGDTVYASARNLFVATHRYEPRLQAQTTGEAPAGETTQIHRFSLDDADNTTYRGSGQVPGFLLNQFSLSERNDVLRAASTDTPPWFRAGSGSHSLVTTLRERPDGLEPLGQVGGLGRGERIYAVRFLGDAGYVVTFRQTDPLYTVDLSDPAAPAVRGELELPGFSSYLHPIGDGRLIGVGSGPTEDGRRSGLQLSEFDVSDLAHPRLEQRTTLPNAFSDVAYDHHAFLWWPPLALAVLPVTQFDDVSTTAPPASPGASHPAPPPSRGFAGAVGFTVRPAGIAEAGRVSHTQGAPVTRSLVIGDTLYTLSAAGLKATALAGFAETGFASFRPQ